MYDRFKNQYIFKRSNERTINFFYKENTGICASVLNKRNMWTESTILIKDCYRGFSADIDKNDNIHILYQDFKGNLSTVRYSDSEFKIKPLLSSKSITAYDKKLTALSIYDRTYFFYVLEHNGNKLLSYQNYLLDSTFSQPKVIDYCLDSKIPYFTFADSIGSVMVFYFSADSRHKCPGLKIINGEKGSISDFIPVSNLFEDASILGGVCDSTGTCHFIWDRKKEGKYELCYVSRALGSETFTAEQIIEVSTNPHTNSSIIEKDSVIICYWTTDNTIFFSTSSDSKVFSEPKKYILFDGKPFYCITFKSNSADRDSNINCFSVPANFTNGYRLAFSDISQIKMPSVKTTNKPIENASSSISIESLEGYNENNKNLNNKINDLEKKVGQIELELKKTVIKTGLLENELSKIKKENTNIYPQAKVQEQYNISSKSNTQFDDKLSKSFKYLESKFDDNNFIQDPRIEETKKEIAKMTNLQTTSNNLPQESKTQITQVSTPIIQNNLPKINNDTPIMPGAGFSRITAQYLKNLGKR